MATSKIQNLPLEWVRVFEAAGRTGSFTAAAQEVGITQAAVSQRMRNLETRIGTSLFTRQARGVTLTVDGEAWLPHVTNALQILNRSSDELFGKPSKKIIISASTSVIQLWIAPRLIALRTKSKYQISLSTMTIEADFERTDAMISVRYGTGHWPDLRCARLFQEILSPLMSPVLQKPGIHWRDLPRIAISGPRPGWQEWATQTGETAPVIPEYRFDSFAAAHAAAKAGLGVILGSIPLCTKELAENTLMRLSKKNLVLDSGYWMTTKDGKLRQSQWQELVGCLCQTPIKT